MKKHIPPLIDALYIIGCSVFGLGGIAIGLFSIIVLLACLVRPFIHWQRWTKTLRTLLAAMLIFATNMTTLLWLFLYHSGVGWLLGLLLFIVDLALLVQRKKWFNLSWRHGAEIAVIVALALEVGFLNSYPGERPVDSSGAELLIDYRAFPDNRPMSLQIVADDDEEVFFIRNRLDKSKRGRKNQSLMRYDATTGVVETVDLDGLIAQYVVYDPYFKAFLALGFDEAPPFYFRNESKHILFRIDRSGEVRERIPLKIPGDRYSFLLTTPDEIQVFSAISDMEAIDRKTNEHRLHDLRIFAGISVVTNLLAWEGNYVVNFGGTILEFLLFPGIRIIDGRTYDTLRRGRFLCGTYVLAWDPVRREFYTNHQWSGTLTVLDENLRVKRRVPLGRVIRSLAIDPERRVGYINDYIRGNMVSFSLDTGEKLGSAYIGKHGRGIYICRDGSVISGSRWGLYRIHFSRIAPPIK